MRWVTVSFFVSILGVSLRMWLEKDGAFQTTLVAKSFTFDELGASNPNQALSMHSDLLRATVELEATGVAPPNKWDGSTLEQVGLLPPADTTCRSLEIGIGPDPVHGRVRLNVFPSENSAACAWKLVLGTSPQKPNQLLGGIKAIAFSLPPPATSLMVFQGTSSAGRLYTAFPSVPNGACSQTGSFFLARMLAQTRVDLSGDVFLNQFSLVPDAGQLSSALSANVTVDLSAWHTLTRRGNLWPWVRSLLGVWVAAVVVLAGLGGVVLDLKKLGWWRRLARRRGKRTRGPALSGKARDPQGKRTP